MFFSFLPKEKKIQPFFNSFLHSYRVVVQCKFSKVHADNLGLFLNGFFFK